MPDPKPMTPLALSAYTLVTANGRGVGAIRVKAVRLRRCDVENIDRASSRPRGFFTR